MQAVALKAFEPMSQKFVTVAAVVIFACSVELGGTSAQVRPVAVPKSMMTTL